MGRAALALRPDMQHLFLFGPLAADPVIDILLAGQGQPLRARLDAYCAVGSPHDPLPGLTPGTGRVEGLLVADADPALAARVVFAANALGLAQQSVTIHTDDGACRQAVTFSAPLRAAPDWDRPAWHQRWQDTFVEGLRDILDQMGHADPVRFKRRLGQIFTRAGARVRAALPRPGTASLRYSPAPGDVATLALERPYTAFFAVEAHDLTHRRFDGTLSAPLNRAVFVSGDAAIVLPYDPVRDKVMLIEQFRAGPYVRGDANPWLLEAIAGRIDGGETPEEAALREAEEEAGLTLRRLIAGPRYYPTPGAKAEYLYSFIGLADLPDDAAGPGGLAEEAEDIRSHIISFPRLMDLLTSGEIDNAPLMLIALWLDRVRPGLRQG